MNELKIQRLVKIFIVFSFATFAFLVFIGNLMDFDSNYQFVKHVLAMDTTFKGNALMWRSIHNKYFWLAAYWFLIILEGIVAVIGYTGTFKMIKNLNSSLVEFSKSKIFGYCMFISALLIWYVGFAIIGSEWFAMWQSSKWNGKQTAMDITGVIIGFLIIFMIPETEKNKT